MTIGVLAHGLAAGVLAGVFGIGGGLVIVPASIILFKMKELDAPSLPSDCLSADSLARASRWGCHRESCNAVSEVV